ncbi:MAG: hypothetical protein H0T84_14540 [Tatlockia sp.]|nr:hypothetical protein [Tatlockia sp.]
MKSKFEGLPRELYEERICSDFKSNSKELSSLALTSKAFYTLFQPKRLVDTLLHHVAWGNQDGAEKMLKTCPELMIKKGAIIDPSMRYFKNISAFELVLWTLDVRYMATMMLNCLPNDATGLKIAKALKAQYEYFDKNGVTYTLDKETITEKHFDFSDLINALQSLIKKS